MREQDDAEIVFAGLQADGCQVTNVFLCQYALEILEAPARKGRQRLSHVGDVAEGEEPAAPVGKLADIFPGAGLLELLNELG